MSSTNKLTDPYGHLEYCIGSADDFWCFDYYRHDDGTVTLHAVINSETGSFIQDARPPVRVPIAEAVAMAQELVEAALAWCVDNELEHDQKGWNQSPCYFWRVLHADIAENGPAIRIPVKMVVRPIITRNYL